MATNGYSTTSPTALKTRPRPTKGARERDAAKESKRMGTALANACENSCALKEEVKVVNAGEFNLTRQHRKHFKSYSDLHALNRLHRAQT